MYIEVELKLNSFDILQLRTLSEARIKELKELKKANKDKWFIANMADEQITNHKITLAKLDAAHEDVLRIAREAKAGSTATVARRLDRKTV